jgi:hypothetical protein
MRLVWHAGYPDPRLGYDAIQRLCMNTIPSDYLRGRNEFIPICVSKSQYFDTIRR